MTLGAAVDAGILVALLWARSPGPTSSAHNEEIFGNMVRNLVKGRITLT